MANIAMSVADPAVLPAYSTVFAGTTDINDIVKLSSQTSWTRAHRLPLGFATAFATQSMDLIGERAIKQNWTLDPTVVPEKLRAMRAALQWVTQGPECVGGDVLLLKTYQPAKYENGRCISCGDQPGYYFCVDNDLCELPVDWLKIGKRPNDVPRNAWYSAQCDGCYVWVNAEGMDGLSRFSLILQKIARTDLETAYFPVLRIRTIDNIIRISGNTYKVTVYVDQDDNLATGPKIPAMPRKVRVDNVGRNADLKSIINASAKSP